MNDAVAGRDIGLEDTRPIDHHALVRRLDRHFLTLNGLGAGELDHICCRHLSGHDMVGQDCDELVFVLGLEKLGHRALRQRLESIVRGGKHREWAIALQNFDQTGSLDRRDQCLERTSRDRHVYDVHISALRVGCVLRDGRRGRQNSSSGHEGNANRFHLLSPSRC